MSFHPLGASTPRPARFDLRLRQGRGRCGLDAWIATPAGPIAGAPIVTVHGVNREAEQHARLLAPLAAAAGRVVVAPRFDADRWPRYQRAVVGERADLALLALLRELRLEGVVHGPGLSLTGFSGGAQFAHRFAMLYPHLVSSLTVTAAGWWTFPDDAPFPYGLGDGGRAWGPSLRAGLDRFLRLPIQVCVGDRDSVRDANTRGGPAIDAQQGEVRRERARRWAEAVTQAARRRGIAPRVLFRVLPGCGHDFAQCFRTGGLDAIILDAAEGGLDRPLCGGCRAVVRAA